ncbi:MAG: hypothetical protein PVF66_10025 [Candidatus Aminicenantes bacterium]|jgi:hypothetical protein
MYTIKVEGCLDKKWADWFEDMEMNYEGDVTVLKGPVADQAALHGLLARIRDLNLVLLSVEHVESDKLKDNE